MKGQAKVREPVEQRELAAASERVRLKEVEQMESERHGSEPELELAL